MKFHKGHSINLIDITGMVNNNLIVLYRYPNNVKLLRVKCLICGSELDMEIVPFKKNKSTKCLTCSDNRLITKRPDLIKYLKNKEDAEKYTLRSEKRIVCECPECKSIKSMSVSNLVGYGFACDICSDKISKPEKFAINILNSLGVEYKRQKRFDWSDRKIYDFYIPSLNMIIETHGGQHYKNASFNTKGSKSLEEEQKNDIYKETLAKNNNIDKYIVVDCRNSDFSFLKHNFIKSLSIYFNMGNIDWDFILEKTYNDSIVLESVKLFNEGLTIQEISKKLNLNRSTIRKYLKIGEKLNLCDYVPKKINMRKKPIYKYDLEYNLVEQYQSLSEACVRNNLSNSTMNRYLKNKIEDNFIWSCEILYKSDNDVVKDVIMND